MNSHKMVTEPEKAELSSHYAKRSCRSTEAEAVRVCAATCSCERRGGVVPSIFESTFCRKSWTDMRRFDLRLKGSRWD